MGLISRKSDDWGDVYVDSNNRMIFRVNNGEFIIADGLRFGPEFANTLAQALTNAAHETVVIAREFYDNDYMTEDEFRKWCASSPSITEFSMKRAIENSKAYTNPNLRGDFFIRAAGAMAQCGNQTVADWVYHQRTGKWPT